MAATGRRPLPYGHGSVWAGSARAIFVLLCCATAFAQQPNKTIYRQVTHVATALTAGNAADAMTTFDKAFSGYDRLHDYFSALTNAYQVVNEIEVTGEQIADSEATLTVHWVMTLSDSQTRSEDLTVKLNLRESKWRIVDFSPIEFFNPQLQKSK
jgi:hypothetical protein